MAYVPDYDQDVFVSYTHLDNEGDWPWVTTLVRDLNHEIRRRLGTKDLHIWQDDSFDGNRPITPDTLQGNCSTHPGLAIALI